MSLLFYLLMLLVVCEKCACLQCQASGGRSARGEMLTPGSTARSTKGHGDDRKRWGFRLGTAVDTAGSNKKKKQIKRKRTQGRRAGT